MGAEVAAVTAKINSDTTGFDAGVDRATGKLSELEKQTQDTEEAVAELGKGGVESIGFLHDAVEGQGEGFGDIAKELAVATLAAEGVKKVAEFVKDLAKEFVANAAAAEMVGRQFQAAFGDGAAEASEWAEKTGQALGRSQDDLEKTATSARVMVGGLGLGAEQADAMAEALANMATQMSIARGIPLDQAIQALDAGMHGAGRGLYEYGIALNTATQDQEAMRLGLGDTYSKLTQAQQAQVNFALITTGSTKIAIEAAQASGTYSNQVASLKSSWEEMTAHIGAEVLPALSSTVSIINELVKGFDALSGSTKGWILAFAVGPIGIAIKQLREAMAEAKSVLGSTPSGPSDADLKEAREHDAKANRERAEALAHIDEEEAKRLAAAAKLKAFNLDADKEEAEHDQQVYQDQLAAAQKRAQVVARALQAAASAQQKMDSLHAAEVQSAAQAMLKAASEVFKVQHDSAVEAEKVAGDQLAAAEKKFDDLRSNGGSSSDIAAAKTAMDAAAAHVQSTIVAVEGLDQSRLQILATQLQQQHAAVQADIDAQTGANEILSAAKLQLQTDIDDHASAAQLRADEEALKAAVETATKAGEAYKKALGDAQAAQDAADAAQKDLNELHVKAWKDGADYAAKVQKAADEDHKKMVEAWAAMGTRAAGSLGGSALGSMVSGAQSMSAAGPAGMAAGAGLSLLEQSQGAKDLAASVSGVLQHAADAIGQLLGPLVPIIEKVGQALGPLTRALDDLFGAAGNDLVAVLTPLVPVIGMLSGLLRNILDPLAQLLQELAPLIQIIMDLTLIGLAPLIAMFAPFVAELLALGKVLAWAANGITAVVNGIASVWNSVVAMVQSVLDTIADILPGAHTGDGLKAFASSLDSFKISTDSATASVSGMTLAAQTFTDSLITQAQQHQAAAAAASQAEQADESKIVALIAAIATAQAQGASQAQIDALRKALTQAMSQQASDTDTMNLEQALADQAAGKTGWQQELQDAYSKQALDQAAAVSSANANTAATATNTKVTQALTASLTNVPAMFKAAQVVDQVLSGQWNGGGAGGGAALGSTIGTTPQQEAMNSRIAAAIGSGPSIYSGVVINGDVHVTADTSDIFDAIAKQLSRQKFARTGTKPRDLVSRHLLAGQG